MLRVSYLNYIFLHPFSLSLNANMHIIPKCYSDKASYTQIKKNVSYIIKIMIHIKHN